MIKPLLAATALLACFSTASLSAEMMACDDANIMKMEESAMAMKDPAMKDTMMKAMEQVEKAKMAMKANDMPDCQKHLDNVMKAAMKADEMKAEAMKAGEAVACDDASIMKAEEGAMAMKDPAMKESMEMAMKEVEMAKMAMKESKTDECAMHLDAAMKATAK